MPDVDLRPVKRMFVQTPCWECVISLDGYPGRPGWASEILVGLIPGHVYEQQTTLKGRLKAMRQVWKRDWPSMLEFYDRKGVDDLIAALVEMRDYTFAEDEQAAQAEEKQENESNLASE